MAFVGGKAFEIEKALRAIDAGEEAGRREAARLIGPRQPASRAGTHLRIGRPGPVRRATPQFAAQPDRTHKPSAPPELPPAYPLEEKLKEARVNSFNVIKELIQNDRARSVVLMYLIDSKKIQGHTNPADLVRAKAFIHRHIDNIKRRLEQSAFGPAGLVLEALVLLKELRKQCRI